MVSFCYAVAAEAMLGEDPFKSRGHFCKFESFTIIVG